MSEQQERVEINWVQVSASALAAVTSAVLLSTVGVAGTMIGAALGAVVVTVGKELYVHSLRISRDRVARAQAAALERVSRARVSVSGASADVQNGPDATTRTQERAQREVQQAGEELEQAEHALQDAEGAEGGPDPMSWREVLAGLPWKRISALAGGVFVLAMLVILTFELITGRAVSTYTGGTSDDDARTSVPGIGLAASTTKQTPTPTPSETTSPESSGAEPSSRATPSESATPGASEGGSPNASRGSEPTTPTPTTGPVTPTPSDAPTPTVGETPAG